MLELIDRLFFLPGVFGPILPAHQRHIDAPNNGPLFVS